MSLALAYYILLLAYVIVEVMTKPLNLKEHRSNLLLLGLLLLLGYAQFGPPLHR